jgi:hypothetical protein
VTHRPNGAATSSRRLRWVSLGALCLLAGVARGALEVYPDPAVVEENATFRLVIRADTTNPGGELDLAPLRHDFDVLGQQTSSQFRAINGRIESSLDWVLTLRPRRSGTIEIPPLTIGDETTAPITITVRPLDPDVRAALGQRVFFETDVSTRRPYVDAQVVIRRALYYAEGVQLYGELPPTLDVPGTIVQRLSEPRHRTTVREGERYGVLEEAFALFPESSGALVIPSVSLTASVTLPARDGTAPRRRELKVTSQPIELDVRPVPAAYPTDAPWLPATEVEILEDWPESTGDLPVGTPRRRVLIVRAAGITAAVIPPLATEYPAGVRTYPEVPVLRDVATADGVVATRTEATSLVATRPGAAALPPTSLVWWDTAEERVRVARLDARAIDFVGEPIETAPRASVTASPEATAGIDVASTEPPHDDAVDGQLAVFIDAVPLEGVLLALAAALLVAALLTAGWREGMRIRRARAADPHRLERLAWRQFRAACAGSDPHRIRAALDRWLCARYRVRLEHALRHFTREPAARDAVAMLNRTLYGTPLGGTQLGGTPLGAPFDASALLAAVNAARRTPSLAASDLPPLYPAPRPS